MIHIEKFIKKGATVQDKGITLYGYFFGIIPSVILIRDKLMKQNLFH